MDAELPGVAEGADLFGLAGGVLGLAVLDVAFAGAHLPVGAELDAVGRVEVDGLDLALEALLLGQAGHHQQRVAQDHAVRPVALVVVEIDAVGELSGQAVEVGEQVELAAGMIDVRELIDDRLWVDLLLDVDRHDRHREILAVLLVFALPDQLRIERRVARIKHGLRRVLVVGHEIPQFLGGDVLALVLVLQ